MRSGLILVYVSLASALHNFSSSHAPFRPSDSDAFKQDDQHFTKPDDAFNEKKVTAFFKLAHSRMDEHDVKALATSLLPTYMQLCVVVPECDSMVREMYGAHHTEAQMELDRMDKLQFVLGRIMRMRGRMATRFGIQHGHHHHRRFRKRRFEA